MKSVCLLLFVFVRIIVSIKLRVFFRTAFSLLDGFLFFEVVFNIFNSFCFVLVLCNISMPCFAQI